MSAAPAIDTRYLLQQLGAMLAIPSPSGFTDEVVHYVAEELARLGLDVHITRRGTVVARLEGRSAEPARAVANHLDTIGAMVKAIKPNGRLQLKPLGTWSSRFAEGGKVTVFTRGGAYRGQVLPNLASGHAFNERVDLLEISWDAVELRLNEEVFSAAETEALGIQPGDTVAFDPDPEFCANGYLLSRHLDDKAGAAALLAALKFLREQGITPTQDLYALFTVTEEVGTGASSSLPPEVQELVGIDIGPVAAGQNAREKGVTLCALDTSGPFDRHLTRHLRELCRRDDIAHQMDVYRYYYSDANAALMAGHDVRDALITFGTDATHGYERTHLNSLESVARLVVSYAQSPPVTAAMDVSPAQRV